jgi:hypothetical protein
LQHNLGEHWMQVEVDMRKVAILWLACSVLPSLNAFSQNRSVTLKGEATEGQPFRKSIGEGLDFVLIPNSDGDSGWTIAISPQIKASDLDCEDFLWVATPPYHFQNARYLDTQYDVTAQEAVRDSPREFNFVLNCTDYETERKRAELAIYPSNESRQKVEEAQSKLGMSPLGKGRLWIEDSTVTPGHNGGTGQALGAIHWIKFRVEINFPSPAPRQPKQ